MSDLESLLTQALRKGSKYDLESVLTQLHNEYTGYKTTFDGSSYFAFSGFSAKGRAEVAAKILLSYGFPVGEPTPRINKSCTWDYAIKLD
jgi:hypothetical protein